MRVYVKRHGFSCVYVGEDYQWHEETGRCLSKASDHLTSWSSINNLHTATFFVRGYQKAGTSLVHGETILIMCISEVYLCSVSTSVTKRMWIGVVWLEWRDSVIGVAWLGWRDWGGVIGVAWLGWRDWDGVIGVSWLEWWLSKAAAGLNW